MNDDSYLDVMTKRLTSYPTFAAMVAAGHRPEYRPSRSLASAMAPWQERQKVKQQYAILAAAYDAAVKEE